MGGGQRRAILYGDSLILTGVRASLAQCPGLEVIVVDHPRGQRLCELAACCPAALVFDLAATRPEILLSLLQQPGLLLIGMDPETHQALVWSGRQATAVSAADMVQLFMGERAGVDAPAH